ncbi:MAG TPA: 4-amino-4-deoxychorismate lyase, partial [Deltaproteobacteria bacterium]|nr:4-amino-4-deoxychorismate lyase [Deltaproteobacteria bacterium]
MATDTPSPPVLCLNGDLVPEAEATLSPFDHGVTVGDGVFETLRTFGPQIFAWSRHHDRLSHSATVMGLMPVGSDVLRGWAERVVQANKHPHSRVRVTLTGGPSAPSTARSGSAVTVLITATPLQPPLAETKVITVPWTRNERSALAGLKTTSYGENV